MSASKNLEDFRNDVLEEAAKAAETAQISGSLVRPGVAKVIRAMKTHTAEQEHKRNSPFVPVQNTGTNVHNLIEVMKVVEDHITSIYTAIANGNEESGKNFADNDPVVKAMRSAIAKATSPSTPDMEEVSHG